MTVVVKCIVNYYIPRYTDVVSMLHVSMLVHGNGMYNTACVCMPACLAQGT